MIHHDAQRAALDPVERRRLAYEVAAELAADVRTVLKVIDGRPVRGLVGARILRALEERRRAA